MKSLIHSLALALMWFTRIPIPLRMNDSKNLQLQSLAWTPLVGSLVGTLLAGTLVILASKAWMAAILSWTLLLLFTGALHEDGWADGWDALGASGDTQRMLSVLKDPRLGTFGTLALIANAAIVITGLFEISQLPHRDVLVLLVGISIASRIFMAPIAWKIPYVRPMGDGKAEFLREKVEAWAWGLWALQVFAFLALAFLFGRSEWILPWLFAFSFPILSVAYWQQKFGGMTGDLYGFSQQAGWLAGMVGASLCI